MNTLPNIDESWVFSGLPRTEPPRIVRRFAIIMVLILLLIIAVLLFAPWQQNVPGKGEVIAFSPLERQQEIESPIKGQIKRWYIQEGSVVKEGDLIAEISDVDPQYLERLFQQRQNLQEQVRFGESKILNYMQRVTDFDTVRQSSQLSGDAKVAALEQQLPGVKQEQQANEVAVATARRNLERETILQEKGLSSQRKLELTELKYQKAISKLAKTKAKLKELGKKPLIA